MLDNDWDKDICSNADAYLASASLALLTMSIG